MHQYEKSRTREDAPEPYERMVVSGWSSGHRGATRVELLTDVLPSPTYLPSCAAAGPCRELGVCDGAQVAAPWAWGATHGISGCNGCGGGWLEHHVAAAWL